MDGRQAGRRTHGLMNQRTDGRKPALSVNGAVSQAGGKGEERAGRLEGILLGASFLYVTVNPDPASAPADTSACPAWSSGGMYAPKRPSTWAVHPQYGMSLSRYLRVYKQTGTKKPST